MRVDTERGLVMQIVDQFPHYGAENFVASLSSELPRLGVPVMILTVRQSKEHAAAGVPVVCAGRRSRADLGFLFRMVRLVRKHRPAIVHTHGYHGKVWGRWAAVLAGVPVIVHTEHNSDLSAGALLRRVNTAANRFTAKFITFSERLASQLVTQEHIARERIVIVPNGVSAPRASADSGARLRLEIGVPASARVLLHVGRLTGLKNQELAIRALDLVTKADPAGEYRLLFAGQGEDEHRLRALCAQLQLGPLVHFLGYRTDVEELMRLAHALVMTSRHEAMPLVVLQAMYANTPVVSAPWDGVRELLGNGERGFIAADFSPGSLAEALLGCFADPARKERVAARAHACARSEYDIRVTAQRHANLYWELYASEDKFARGKRHAG